MENKKNTPVTEIKDPESKPEKSNAETTPRYKSITRFIYAGPGLPGLKSNTVIKGSYDDVKLFYKDILDKYPTAERLIIPVERISEIAGRIKSPGNAYYNFYSEILKEKAKRTEEK